MVGADLTQAARHAGFDSLRQLLGGSKTKMTIHIGLIGGGNITETHARATRAISGVEIAAFYGTNAEKIAGLCREYGGEQYLDFEEFLAHRPMDMVMIGALRDCMGLMELRRFSAACTYLPRNRSKSASNARMRLLKLRSAPA